MHFAHVYLFKLHLQPVEMKNKSVSLAITVTNLVGSTDHYILLAGGSAALVINVPLFMQWHACSWGPPVLLLPRLGEIQNKNSKKPHTVVDRSCWIMTMSRSELL